MAPPGPRPAQTRLLETELDAAVAELPLFRVVCGYRARIAVPFGNQHSRRNPLLDEKVSNGIRALLREGHVRSRVAGVIRMAGDLEDRTRWRRLDGHGHAIQVIGAVGRNLCAAGSEVDHVQIEGGDQVLRGKTGLQGNQRGAGLLGCDANLFLDERGSAP